MYPEELDDFSDTEIVERWNSSLKEPLVVKHWQAAEELGSAESKAVSDCLSEYPNHLGDLSEFIYEILKRALSQYGECCLKTIGFP